MSKSNKDSEGETTTTITATTHLTLPAQPTPLTYDQLNPKSHATEFLGPIGTAGISIIAPLTSYFLFYACNEGTGCPPTSMTDWATIWKRLGGWPSSSGQLWEWKAAGVYLVWYAFCVMCWAILPSEKAQGNLLRDGKRVIYRMNGVSPFQPGADTALADEQTPQGFYTLLLTLGISVGVLLQPRGIENFTWLYDHWVPLVSASLAMATFQAFFVYTWSFQSGELLALGGNSGVFVYDVCT